MMKIAKKILVVVCISIFTGCSTSSYVTTQKSLPKVYEDANATVQNKNDVTITLFRLNNYTDTPRAGMRASNLVEGILLSKGYVIKNRMVEKVPTLKKARKIAQKDASKYFIYGGVSEWRYKTGIDGEPAVSLQVSLYKTENLEVVWSATGSDSDWGNASIGTTAQDLLHKMMF